MYYYIYDAFLEEDKRYAKQLTKVETQVNNLGLTGERTRITTIKKIDQLVSDAAQKGYNPIVIVGRDQTFSEAASTLAKINSNTVLAFVPLEKKSLIGQMLGVDLGNAIVTLSRKVIKRVPLASANGHYFMAVVSCSLNNKEENKFIKFFKRYKKADVFEPELNLDQRCLVKSQATSMNIYPGFSISRLKIKVNNESIAKKDKKVEQSIFWPSQAVIDCKQAVPVSIDGRRISRTPLDLRLTDRSVNLIVGSARRFA